MEENQLHIPDGWESKELGSLYFERRKLKLNPPCSYPLISN